MTVQVDFCREIREGMRGGDVIAHKRALARWDSTVYPWAKFTDMAGPFFINAVLEYKHRHKLGNTRVLGQQAHNSMENQVGVRGPNKGQPIFDKAAVGFASEFCATFGKSPDRVVRDRIVAAAFYWYSRRMQIAYSESRPFSVVVPPNVPRRWDCSAFATNCHLAGGAPNPNGSVPSGEGYTGTLIDHGTRVSTVAQLDPGDLIFYGFCRYSAPGFRYGDPTHVAVYVGKHNGIDAVISNGKYPMGLLPYNYWMPVNQFRHYNVV